MASMLVAALEEAERERDLSVAREPTSAELAAAAWSKLQYDFPVVSPAELDALAKEMEAEAGGGTGPPSAGAALAYAPTNSLVNAVIEGASRAPADAAADDASASALRRAFQRLCAVVLVRAPARLARGDALARADAFLSRYRSAATRDGETSRRAMEHTMSRDADADTHRRSSSSSADTRDTQEFADADADADADSDADWEPLEVSGGASYDAAPPRFARDASVACSEHDETCTTTCTTTDVKTRVHRKLRDLLERARYAYFDAEDASNGAARTSGASAWTLRGVGNAAAELVELFYSDKNEHNTHNNSAAAACGGYALRLLRERWRVAGVGAEARTRCGEVCARSGSWTKTLHQIAKTTARASPRASRFLVSCALRSCSSRARARAWPTLEARRGGRQDDTRKRRRARPRCGQSRRRRWRPSRGRSTRRSPISKTHPRNENASAKRRSGSTRTRRRVAR